VTLNTKKEFIDDILTKYKNSPLDVVRKYLINGSSYFFEHIGTEDNEYNIKKDIAKSLKIHPNNIIIVGSGKLGFSIKPTDKEYPLNNFRIETTYDKEESDIDIAVISSQLFEEKLQAIHSFLRSYDLSRIFEVFDDCRKKRKHKKCFDDFSRYILLGWLRPDKMPKGFELFDGVAEIQKQYRKTYNRKINIGIYKSWEYFEDYNIQNIKSIQIYLNQKENNE